MTGERLDTIDDGVHSGLRRWPDIEAPNLHAVDASDRLILDEAAAAIAESGPGEVVVIGDAYGALTIGVAALGGAAGIRVFQDSIVGERALAANADGAVDYLSLPLGAELTLRCGYMPADASST